MANVTNRGSRTNPKWYGKYRDPSAKGGWRQKHTMKRGASCRNLRWCSSVGLGWQSDAFS